MSGGGAFYICMWQSSFAGESICVRRADEKSDSLTRMTSRLTVSTLNRHSGFPQLNPAIFGDFYWYFFVHLLVNLSARIVFVCMTIWSTHRLNKLFFFI